MAAASMGYEVIVFCQQENEPAAQVCHRVVTGAWDDREAIDRFASQCDVISLEFENIPSPTIADCARHAATHPHANVLAIVQDRLLEKGTLSDAGLPVTPFAPVDSRESAVEAAESLGWPMIIKTCRSGYDGKGQFQVGGEADLQPSDFADGGRWIAEKRIDFDREISVVVARTVSGQVQTFPIFENQHRNHILDVTTTPAAVSEQLAERARQVAIETAEVLDAVGLLCVEMFVCDEQVMINEVAPRPHNSGHLTIEACHTSQFEQQVRAICNLPLGRTDLVCGGAAMANLLGDLWSADGDPPDWTQALEVDPVRLHLYGKRLAKPGRKMGHLTALGDTPESVAERVRAARSRLQH